MTDRRNTSSLKWDVNDGELPMWVADMDFKTAPEIINAISEKAAQGIFGYSTVSYEWQDSIINWWKRRHSFNIDRNWLIFCTGIVPAITSSIKRVTNIGDSILVLTPAYDIFYHSIENSGRHVLECPLNYDSDSLSYSIDFVSLEKKLSYPLTTMMILCNPQNPSGNLWSAGELSLIGELCDKHHVTVLSDEIHCDITSPGFAYTPFASVSKLNADISITCISASKAFNLAGLQSAAAVIPNDALRENINRGLNSDEIAEPNSFAICSAAAAFNYGEKWLDSLNKYIYENKKALDAFLKENLPDVRMVPSDSTYLAWLDCSEYNGKINIPYLISEINGDASSESDLLKIYLRHNTGLYLCSGSVYRGNGASFLRMNIACPKQRLSDGLNRLKIGLTSLYNSKVL
jgi:cystathionine beta-lyase